MTMLTSLIRVGCINRTHVKKKQSLLLHGLMARAGCRVTFWWLAMQWLKLDFGHWLGRPHKRQLDRDIVDLFVDQLAAYFEDQKATHWPKTYEEPG